MAMVSLGNRARRSGDGLVVTGAQHRQHASC